MHWRRYRPHFCGDLGLWGSSGEREWEDSDIRGEWSILSYFGSLLPSSLTICCFFTGKGGREQRIASTPPSVASTLPHWAVPCHERVQLRLILIQWKGSSASTEGFIVCFTQLKTCRQEISSLLLGRGSLYHGNDLRSTRQCLTECHPEPADTHHGVGHSCEWKMNSWWQSLAWLNFDNKWHGGVRAEGDCN